MSAKRTRRPFPKKAIVGKLDTRTWTISTVTLDNQDVTALFAGLTLTFSDNKYTTTNSQPPVWNEKGVFALAGFAPNFHLTREEGFDVKILETPVKLLMDFRYDRIMNGARTNSESGNYHFEFN